MSGRDDDLKREIEQHLELDAAEREADGLSADQARSAAARAFGNVSRIREDARAVWFPLWLEHLAQDLRYASRLARRDKGFTLGAVLILAIGISTTTTLFGALKAVVLAPLPFDRPAQLVRLFQTNPSRGVERFSVSLPLYRDWRARSRSFAELAAQKDGSASVQGAGEPQQVPVRWITSTMLPMLGLHAALGRGFLAADDQPAAAKVVILSDGFWRRSLGADPGAIGRTLVLDGQPHEIVGVTPADSLFLDDHLIVPLGPVAADRRGQAELDVFARLRPDVRLEQAISEMTAIATQLALDYPEGQRGWGVAVVPLADVVLGHRAPRVLYFLIAAVGLLLLVACANLSSLLLVRATGRTREMAIRTAVGGGRGRIVRQLLTESLLLGLVGGALGIALSYRGMHLVRALAKADLPRAQDIQVDVWVMVFALATAVIAGVLAGLAPARQVARLDVQGSLKASAPAVLGGASRARNGLIVGQLALSVVLLAAAAVTTRAFYRLAAVDLGFTTARIVTFQVAPHDNPEVFLASLLERLRGLPDVAQAGATSGAPLTPGNTSLNVYPVGQALLAPSESVQADWRDVTEGFFGAMETPILAGRDFTARDNDDAPKVIIVNQTLARMMWGTENPIGRQLDLGGGGGKPATVVGLVRDVRTHNPGRPASAAYYGSAYRGVWGPMTFTIRTGTDASRLLPRIRAEVSALDPALPLFSVRTMESLLDAQLAPHRLVAGLLTGFAAIAMILALVGVYGVMAHSTGQRSRESAIRLALGATRAEVIRPLMREGGTLALLGSMAGFGLAILTSSLMRGLVGDAGVVDPVMAIAVAGALTIAALAACFLPARRAANVNPLGVLRRD